MNKIGSSETIRKTTFNFYNYKQNTVSHKKHINTSFLEWFIGFTEGDSSFIVSNQRLFFIINQKEEKILYNIRTNLGFGKVSTYQNYSRYIVADKTNVDRLIFLFNGNLQLEKTKRLFRLWLSARNQYSEKKICFLTTKKEIHTKNQIFSIQEGIQKKECIQCVRTLQKQSNNKKKQDLSFNFSENGWLSGFIDAQGWFNATRIIDHRYTLGFRVKPTFKLDQKGELQILKKVQFFLKKGYISTLKEYKICCIPCMYPFPCIPSTEYPLYPLKEKIYRFTCNDVKSHDNLIQYLKRYPLRTLKKVSFLRYASLCNYIENRKTLPWQGKVYNRVENLIKNINSLNKKLKRESV